LGAEATKHHSGTLSPTSAREQGEFDIEPTNPMIGTAASAA
jgi:hypothetical protein